MSLIDPPQPKDEEISPVTGLIPYGFLSKQRHPKYYANFWSRIRAFYRGGIHLLENDHIMRQVFPKHVNEEEHVYNMRKSLAHYTNHSGAIVNHLLGKLMADPARVQSDPEMDSFYQKFIEDCSPPGGKEVSVNDLVGQIMLSALQCQNGYALVEMPAQLDVETMSLAEQEASGALDAWCVEVMPESVVGWETDKAGEYQWVLLCFKNNKRPSIFDARDMIQEEYWMYDRSGWIRWDVRYRDGDRPKDDDLIRPTAIGSHTFGKVPLVRLCLPDGLWVMSKLESLAREFFNKRNALSWAEFKALLPVLYEYLDPGMMPTMPGPAGKDNRATAQTRSVAHVMQRQAAPGSGDRAEWVAPPHAPFTHALESVSSIRDEMHRVVQQMALSADNNNAMLKRSADSKAKDSEALDVVLREYGKLARRFIHDLLRLVESGRGDAPHIWTISGINKFDSTSTDFAIEEETILDTVEMPSPTFKSERKKQLARKVLGDSVSEETLNQIDTELETAFSPEGEFQQLDSLEEDQVQENESPEESSPESSQSQSSAGISFNSSPTRRR